MLKKTIRQFWTVRCKPCGKAWALGTRTISNAQRRHYDKNGDCLKRTRIDLQNGGHPDLVLAGPFRYKIEAMLKAHEVNLEELE